MTQKNVDGIIGALPGVLYFVQEGTDWYSNEAGKLLKLLLLARK